MAKLIDSILWFLIQGYLMLLTWYIFSHVNTGRFIKSFAFVKYNIRAPPRN